MSMVKVVDRNIRALLEHREEQRVSRSRKERVVDAVTGFAGSMLFVYLHLALFSLWILANRGWLPGVPQFDPTFVFLALVATLEALFISTFVLISQNRMSSLADKRADLDLQVSLLAEHEITRLITLVTAMAEQMGIDAAHDPELTELSRDLPPEKVMKTMEEHERAAEGRATER